MAKGIILKYSHLPPPSMDPVWGADLLQGHSLPHDHLKYDILSRPSSVVSMGECRQRSGQLSPVSICAARCQHCHTNCTRFLFFSLFLSVALSCIHMLTLTVQREKNIEYKQGRLWLRSNVHISPQLRCKAGKIS